MFMTWRKEDNMWRREGLGVRIRVTVRVRVSARVRVRVKAKVRVRVGDRYRVQPVIVTLDEMRKLAKIARKRCLHFLDKTR